MGWPSWLEQSGLFYWVVLPGLIFLARIVDVSLRTVRVILVTRGQRKAAPVIGFFEILIWLLTIQQILTHLQNWVAYLAYAAGFATGNYLGMVIEDRLALGMQVVRVITREKAGPLIEQLRQQGFGITVVPAEGIQGPVQILFTVIPRKALPRVMEIVRQHTPHAFVSVQDVRLAQEGTFPAGNQSSTWYRQFLRADRKSL